MSGTADDARWMGAALALGTRGCGRTAPNPDVGCVIVKAGRVVGRGWTQPGGRPHAEAMALAEAGDAARGATVFTTLEPCAHVSARGPACSDLLVAAGVARVVAAMVDPDPRTAGAGLARLEAAGIATACGVRGNEAARAMAGFLTRAALGRPFVTLKLALSLDGCIATAAGESRWITGAEARAHTHLERSRHDAILVGRGTWAADAPKLDVRLAGLAARSPRRVVLSGRPAGAGAGTDGEGGADDRAGARVDGWTPTRGRGDGGGYGSVPGGGDAGGGWTWIDRPEAIAGLAGVDRLMVEGGAATAAAFLKAGLVDRLLLYRAPVLIGGGLPALRDFGLAALSEAHGRWVPEDARSLGVDRVEVYGRRACLPES